MTARKIEDVMLADSAKVKYRTKFLGTSTSVNQNDEATLRFEGLTVGKFYQAIIFINCRLLNARGAMRCNHDGVEVGIIRYTNEETANEFFIGSMICSPFQATTTTMTTDINFTINGGGAVDIFGGSNSRVTLLELNNYVEDLTL